MDSMGKSIMFIGAILIFAGFILVVGSKIGLGKLPGDIYVKKTNFVFYFPIVTSIVISIILSIVANLFVRK